MAQDYPLEELSPRAFEQLTAALAHKVLGPGVQTFGSGPDGGREATFTGRVDWSATTEFDPGAWDGYIVLQAKQREHLGSPSSNATWLRQVIKAELDAWVRSDNRRGRFPEYLIFVTNVRLSSVPGVGGIDLLDTYVRDRLKESIPGNSHDSLAHRGLREVRIWHRDQLNTLLTAHASIRNAFKGMLTVGDLLVRLGALGDLLNPAELEPVLRAHSKQTLISERWVNFREAGGDSRQSIENIIIDLKSTGTRNKNTLLKEVVQRGDSVRSRSVDRAAKHIVLTGHPGSGKSTITRFITQLYRVGFPVDEHLTATAESVRAGTAQAVERIGLTAPKNRRWPLRVNLAEYADEVGPSGDKSLLRWMSERVTARAEIDIKPHQLKKWLKNWPSIISLDGLDEVTAPEVRPRVLDAIETFVEASDEDDADLLVIITTRPTGYTERFMPERFDQLDLKYLDTSTALRYGRHVTLRRLADDLDLRDQVISRFEHHASQASMLRLMKTPLQVLIMTLILERFGVLPADRYQLFWRYFETIYEREAAKSTNLAALLAEHRRTIIDLHENVGLSLQVYSETSTDARAILPKSELREMARSRLLETGFEPGVGLDRIVDRIVQASTDRLVLLVPSEDDGIAFEVRSLQEVMAARALSSGTDDELRRRLTITAPSPHWRNTWIFLAGRLITERADHLRDLVLEVVESIDTTSKWPGWLCPVGPELAAQLLDDGLAETTPKWKRRLLDVALRALSGPPPQDMRTYALGLSAGSTGNDLLYVRNALKTALAGTPLSQ